MGFPIFLETPTKTNGKPNAGDFKRWVFPRAFQLAMGSSRLRKRSRIGKEVGIWQSLSKTNEIINHD